MSTLICRVISKIEAAIIKIIIISDIIFLRIIVKGHITVDLQTCRLQTKKNIKHTRQECEHFMCSIPQQLFNSHALSLTHHHCQNRECALISCAAVVLQLCCMLAACWLHAGCMLAASVLQYVLLKSCSIGARIANEQMRLPSSERI